MTADQDTRTGTPAEIAAAEHTLNDLAQAFADSGDFTYAQRHAICDDFRAALNHLRAINGGAAIRLTALDGTQ